MPFAARSLSWLLLWLAMFALAADRLTGQTFYVDGQTGIDAPGNGASPATPWRTIGYALATAQQGAIAMHVRVRGDQSYGTATNGEQWPLALPARCTIEGEPGILGQKPTFVLPSGSTGFTMPNSAPTATWHITPVQGVEFQGGAVALRCGAGPGATHFVTLRAVDFRAQSQTAVLVQPMGGAEQITALDCTFESPGNPGSCAFQYTDWSDSLTLERCRLTQISSLMDLGSVSLVPRCLAALTVRWTTFDRTGGVGSLGGRFLASPPPHYLFEDCRFVASGTFYEFVPGGMGLRRQTTIRRTAFVGCPYVVHCNGAMFEGRSDFDFEDCAFSGCAAVATASSAYHGSYRLRFADCVATGFQTAFALFVGGDLSTVDLQIHRCRIRDGIHGISQWGLTESGSIDVDSSMFTGLSGTAFELQGFHGPGWPAYQRFRFVNLTVADCGVGFAIQSQAASNTFQCIAFDDNGTDATAPAAIQFDNCVTDGPQLTGSNSIANTDPQLIRPQYKLAATSPCIDAGAAVWGSSPTDHEGDARALAGSLTAIPRPDIGADEYAQYGSLRRYGFPGRSRNGVSPTIATNSPVARLGTPYSIRVDNAQETGQAGTSFAFLASGLRDVPDPLPFDLAVFGVEGSYLWCDPQDVASAIAVGASGTAVATFQLPNIQQLAGLPVSHQWLVALPGSFGLVTSDALRVSFGL